MIQQQTYLLEIYRAGMRTAADIMKASLENVQRVQNQQMEAVRGALEDNVRNARELSEVRSLEEMIALQTRAAGAQMERAADLWSRLWKSASEGQAAIIGQVQNQVGVWGSQAASQMAANVSSNTQVSRDQGRDQGREHERKERKSA